LRQDAVQRDRHPQGISEFARRVFAAIDPTLYMPAREAA
jgi:hypothetical protein